jgi:NAD(P)-dependent dehydrogenase (short-subunit alcohol dehydrogenase family)
MLPAEYGLDALRRVIDIDLSGTMCCMKYAIPAMIGSGGRSIVSTAPIPAHAGLPSSDRAAFVKAPYLLVDDDYLAR